MSRHQICVAASNLCRSCHSRSRPPNGVATPFLLPSPQARSRLHFSRSRPPGASPMSRHCFHVATSFQPIMGLPGHDTEIHVATSHTAAHVATSNPCRDAVSAQPKQTRSRLHFLVATSRPTKLGPTQPSQVATPISGHDLKLLLNAPSMSQPQYPSCNPLKPKPGRDLTSMSRLQVTQPMSRHEIHVTTKANQSQPLPNQVATSNMGRDPMLEFGSSHSSFCLAPIFFFSSNPPVAFLPFYS